MTLQPVGRFRGTNAVVTGGAHGIGRACAIRLAAEGALVAVADLDQAAARVVRDHLPDGLGSHLSLAMDVTDSPSVEQAIGQAADELGQIDVSVTVAGGDTEHGRFEDIDDEVWTRMLELNLLGGRRFIKETNQHLRSSARDLAVVS